MLALPGCISEEMAKAHKLINAELQHDYVNITYSESSEGKTISVFIYNYPTKHRDTAILRRKAEKVDDIITSTPGLGPFNFRTIWFSESPTATMPKNHVSFLFTD